MMTRAASERKVGWNERNSQGHHHRCQYRAGGARIDSVGTVGHRTYLLGGKALNMTRWVKGTMNKLLEDTLKYLQITEANIEDVEIRRKSIILAEPRPGITAK